MRITSILVFSVFLILSACRQEQRETRNGANPTGLKINTRANPDLEFENLRLYPISADAAFIEKHAAAAQYQNLREAIGNHRFRITEKKPFGRFEDLGAVNTLTVQNKSEDVVFLMAGDVVQGGKQDRVIAQDLVSPPRTITDIAVFCVEPHRWQAQGETEEAADDPRQQEQNRHIYAFTGYYNVAANDIRRSAARSKNQQEVWDEVGKLTAVHNAQSATGAYAALEQSESFTEARARYLRFFEDKFEDTDNVVGIVAVTGDEVMGADVFGHPALFKKQYKALIHSYITGAATSGQAVQMKQKDMDKYEEKIWQKFQMEEGYEDAKYEFGGLMVHFADL